MQPPPAAAWAAATSTTDLDRDLGQGSILQIPFREGKALPFFMGCSLRVYQLTPLGLYR